MSESDSAGPRDEWTALAEKAGYDLALRKTHATTLNPNDFVGLQVNSFVDGATWARTFELERVSVLIKRLYNTLQQHHQMPNYSEVLADAEEWLKSYGGQGDE